MPIEQVWVIQCVTFNDVQAFSGCGQKGQEDSGEEAKSPLEFDLTVKHDSVKEGSDKDSKPSLIDLQGSINPDEYNQVHKVLYRPAILLQK